MTILDALQDTFFDKLRRSRSFSDLPSLRLSPKAGLELYVSPGFGLVKRVFGPRVAPPFPRMLLVLFSVATHSFC